MSVLYVASDRPGAGKTALCVTLASKLRDQGKKTAVFKPVASLAEGGSADSDPEVYLQLLGQGAEGWPFALPPEGLTDPLLDQIKAAFDVVSTGSDAVLVEGSDGLSAEDSVRIAEALKAKVLVVAQYRRELVASDLGHWKEQLGDLLIGFVINGLTQYLGNEARTRLLPSMESDGLVSLGIVPEDRRMLSVSVAQLAEHLEGKFVVCQERAGALVEYLMIGAMGMDPGELHFGLRENKAVIVRGDRPDIQMAALNTPTACMVLTNGLDPIEYVKYEAEEEEVSVMVVPTETLATMDAASSLMDRAHFDHPQKLARFSELLDEHVDLPALFASINL